MSNLYIYNIYDGCLTCSDLKALNISIIESIPKKVEKLFGSNRPLHIEIPDSYPGKLPSYLALYWGECWPTSDTTNTIDPEFNLEYDGFHLVVAVFVNDISGDSIDAAKKIFVQNFEEKAKGWSY